VLSVGKSESRFKIRSQRSLLGVSLDGNDQLLVHVKLGLFALLIDFVFVFLDLKDFSLSWLGLLWFNSVEKGILDVVWNGDFADVNFGFGGNHVNLIDTSQWATVKLEWTSNEQ